jgi:hypothetical protein
MGNESEDMVIRRHWQQAYVDYRLDQNGKG